MGSSASGMSKTQLLKIGYSILGTKYLTLGVATQMELKSKEIIFIAVSANRV